MPPHGATPLESTWRQRRGPPGDQAPARALLLRVRDPLGPHGAALPRLRRRRERRERIPADEDRPGRRQVLQGALATAPVAPPGDGRHVRRPWRRKELTRRHDPTTALADQGAGPQARRRSLQAALARRAHAPRPDRQHRRGRPPGAADHDRGARRPRLSHRSRAPRGAHRVPPPRRVGPDPQRPDPVHHPGHQDGPERWVQRDPSPLRRHRQHQP